LGSFYPEIESLRDATLEQLQKHQLDMDPVIYRRCHFIIEENQRVLDVAETLASGDHAESGRLGLESFEGARDLYEIVSSEMIAMKDAIMSAPGALGTRGAGAGFGGCLVAFVEDGRVDAFTQHVSEQYHSRTGIEPQIFPGRASDGAGVLEF
jgi:galactokinase